MSNRNLEGKYIIIGNVDNCSRFEKMLNHVATGVDLGSDDRCEILTMYTDDKGNRHVKAVNKKTKEERYISYDGGD